MNKVVKKIAAVALSGLLVASVFAGCSGGSAKDTYTVGICQSMQHPALDKATEGFKKALTDKLGDKVTFKEQNASGDSTLCSTIVNQYVSQNVDWWLPARQPTPFRLWVPPLPATAWLWV